MQAIQLLHPYNETVKLEGEFNYPNLVEWTDKRSAKDYIKLGGGISSYGILKMVSMLLLMAKLLKLKNSNLSILPGSNHCISKT